MWACRAPSGARPRPLIFSLAPQPPLACPLLAPGICTAPRSTPTAGIRAATTKQTPTAAGVGGATGIHTVLLISADFRGWELISRVDVWLWQSSSTPPTFPDS